MTATVADIKTFIADREPICGPVDEWQATHIDDLIPTLVVKTTSVIDAGIWATNFGSKPEHRINHPHVELGENHFTAVAYWQGWHVMVVGRAPMNEAACAPLPQRLAELAEVA